MAYKFVQQTKRLPVLLLLMVAVLTVLSATAVYGNYTVSTGKHNAGDEYDDAKQDTKEYATEKAADTVKQPKETTESWAGWAKEKIQGGLGMTHQDDEEGVHTEQHHGDDASTEVNSKDTEDKIREVVYDAGQSSADKEKQIKNAAAEQADKAKNIASQKTSEATEAASKAKDKSSGALSKAKSTAKEATDKASDQMENTKEATKEKVGEAAEAAKEKMEDVKVTVKEKVGEATEAAKKKGEEAGESMNWAKEKVGEGYKNAGDIVNGVREKVWPAEHTATKGDEPDRENKRGVHEEEL